MTMPYGSPDSGGIKPANNLVMAILVTVLCCLPLGGYSIYLALQSDKAWEAGNAQLAAEYGEKAKKFSIWGIAISLVFSALYVVLIVAGGIAGNSGSY